MNRSFGLACFGVAILVAAGCGKAPESALKSKLVADSQAAHIHAHVAVVPAPPARQSFASLPDRGELIAYGSEPVRRDGAYTWHRTELSEAHALKAAEDGDLRVTTPSGETLLVRYDRRIAHGSGDWTWVGHLPGQESEQTILTFGPHAAFGTIAQSGKPPLRLTVRNGVSWLVETDPTKVAGINNAATRPALPDYHLPPPKNLPQAPSAASAPPMAAAPPTAAATTASTPTTVDVVLGYTPAFAADNGGQSGAITRLNYLVDVTNVAYQNSGIDARVRLVATVPVSYADDTSNDSTLDQLTGYNSSTNTTTSPNAAFNALRAAREQYGADLVSLVRSFRDPENGGCGVAWLIGGGQQGVSASDSYYGYSVVSDGSDPGTDGHTYYCLDETLAHELGHNMGANHDVDTAKGADGVLDSGDYGAYAYSFGYKDAVRAFYTIMAYGDTGQHVVRIFSNPRSTFCGGAVCGSSQADNARTLAQTIPTVATFRASAVLYTILSHDFDGDGRSDVLWRNVASGENTIWLGAVATSRKPVATVAGDGNWKVMGAGDFNGDQVSDILWRNTRTGSNAIWYSGSSSTAKTLMAVTNLDWNIVGIGDFDSDGVSDIFWRNRRSGVNVIWRSGDYATSMPVTTVAQTAWQVVGIGDFNGDGASDVLWRNAATGANTIWRSANSATAQAVVAVSNLDWHVSGIGDFNADGVDDVVWRNVSSGANVIWKSANYASAQTVATIGDRNWTVAEVGDFNGDKKSDLLWRNAATGGNAIWLSADAGTVQSIAGVASTAWTITP